MRSNPRDQNATPQQTYNYVQGLLKVQADDDQSGLSIYEQAVAVCFNYLTQKKIDWSIYLQKLVELFLDLAFETGKHSKIKQVLKSYRSITQNQHPDSLKSILEYYRDNKLQQILDQQIPKDSLGFITEMRSIESDEASSEIILSSFNPAIKNKREEIRVNLKTVWEGYKAIVDTVRFNHKLEGVYKATLKKIFEFVDHYNRKHQFKLFCEYSRSGLRNVMSKRGDKTEQQKGFYIDIEKEEINTSNIEIRLEQFNLTTKLGLWQQAFQILEDINQIMKVRKVAVRNHLKCAYFQKLASIFMKSNYWHYHAFAFFNYYSIFITKSKLPLADKVRTADKLILSVLCIPPSTIQSNQSKESQQKIASMMMSGNKIPDKRELEEMMISRGVVQAASAPIKALWYFMFLDFDLTSLSKGLKLLEQVVKEGEQYKQYLELLENILIYKQLISVAEVYQRIKYSSLISIIPLPQDKIKRVLLECHHRKVIDFVFDEKQGILIFQDQVEEVNPYEQFLTCFTDVALLYEDNRKHDREFIVKKTIDFIENADEYYNKIRQFKIEEYKKFLKKPRLELEEKEREREKKIQQQKRNQQLIKRAKQQEEKAKQEQNVKLFIEKKIKIEEIIKMKQNRIVKIGEKRVENLTDDEIKAMDKEIFEQGLKEITARVASDNENRNKKRFLKVDYTERERRFEIQTIIENAFKNEPDQKQNQERIKVLAKKDHERRENLKAAIQKIAPEVKNKIETHYNANKQKFEDDMISFKENLTMQFKKKILAKARELYEENQKKKKLEEERRRMQEISTGTEQWSFRGGIQRAVEGSGPTTGATADSGDTWKRKVGNEPQPQEEPKKDNFPKLESKTTEPKWGRKAPVAGVTAGNAFSAFRQEDDDEKKQERSGSDKWIGSKKTEEVTPVVQNKKQDDGKWFGKKKTEDQPVEQPKKEAQKFVPPTVQAEAKSAWNRGTAKPTVDINEETKRKASPQIVLKGAPKKGKGW